MKFSNLALCDWSYSKGDKEVSLKNLDISKLIRTRNPVDSTFIYSNEEAWKQILTNHVTEAIETSKLEIDDVGAFLGVHNGENKHPAGASAELMSLFPESKGFMMDFSLGCASVVLGAQLAGLHFLHDDIEKIIMGLVQLNTQYTRNYTDGNCILADSIGAAIFSRSNTGNMVRHTEIDSNPYFRDMFAFDKQGLYKISNLHKSRELTKFMIQSFATQLRKNCMTLKTFPKDIDFFAISCSTYAASKRVLEAMEISLDRSGIECLTRVPHLGANDLFYQLDYGIEQGMIKKGSKVLVTGTSLGFSIATMGIEWGVS